MSERPGRDVLRDRQALQSADVAGLLPAAGSAGAQVRAVAGQLAGRNRIDRPRAMVVVGATASVDTMLLMALISDRAGAPVVTATTLPAWVGPLDLVVVLAAAREDESAAIAAATAQRRGATTFVRAAAEGPVAMAAGAALLPVEVAVPEALAAAARWSLLAGVAALAGLMPTPNLPVVADLLDARALAVHPAAETFANSSVNLAEFLSGGVPVFIGNEPLADAVAAHGAAVLAGVAGVAAAALPSAMAAQSPPVLARIGAGRDLFADPFDDPDAPAEIRPVLISVSGPGPGPAAALLSALRRALPRAVQLDAAESDDFESDPGADLAGMALSGGGPLEPTDPLGSALAVALQIDFAAVYLGIVAGQLAPRDYPDGLGRIGGTRWAVQTANVGDVWNERDD